MIWYEVRMAPGADLTEFYRALQTNSSFDLFHHFWDEPWWRHAYVVRVQTEDSTELEAYPGVDHVVPWDASADERAYGAAWHNVAAFFLASSTLGNQSEKQAMKLVHCFLNARGMSEWDEARFAARLLWNRLTIKLRWRLYMRRRWEQAQT